MLRLDVMRENIEKDTEGGVLREMWNYENW